MIQKHRNPLATPWDILNFLLSLANINIVKLSDVKDEPYNNNHRRRSQVLYSTDKKDTFSSSIHHSSHQLHHGHSLASSFAHIYVENSTPATTTGYPTITQHDAISHPPRLSPPRAIRTRCLKCHNLLGLLARLQRILQPRSRKSNDLLQLQRKISVTSKCYSMLKQLSRCELPDRNVRLRR